ncbi:hypothetical protein IPN35_01550 [Candidatus Peregrinibacteria bacterium]|nr:MAG: hypothetical protein IPN35_01550 [Candidatus Peregrinibacteria bacterium]
MKSAFFLKKNILVNYFSFLLKEEGNLLDEYSEVKTPYFIPSPEWVWRSPLQETPAGEKIGKKQNIVISLYSSPLARLSLRLSP